MTLSINLYSSFIVSVIAILLILFDGAYTAAIDAAMTNTVIIITAAIGAFHAAPKYAVTKLS